MNDTENAPYNNMNMKQQRHPLQTKEMFEAASALDEET